MTASNNTKIAILYIALGRYGVFWRDFYESAEKYFLPDVSKTYFLFTDNEKLEHDTDNNVIKIYQDKLGWPYDTLMRFDIFLTQEDKLAQFDYIFFFNANMQFVDLVGQEILPSDKNDGLAMGLHPGFYNKNINDFTYDRNLQSTAYIPYNSGRFYVQGCLNGGTADAYLKLCHVCSKNIKTDLDKNVIALWHDESHLNKYVLDKNPLIIPCNYLYPESWDLPDFKDNIKIIQRDKNNPKYGGIEWLRGNTNIKQHVFDVVLCVASKDFENLDMTIDLLKKHCDYRNLYVISNKNPDKPGIVYINESDLLDGLNYDAIKQYFINRNVKPSRIGWYLQQFLKIAFCYKCDVDNYLVWDADTLMLRHIDFFDDNDRILYDNSRIWKDDVFNKTVEAVLGYPRNVDTTYIVEHMMMNTSYMKEIVSVIAGKFSVSEKDFWRAILNQISDNDLIYGGFSEFEMIGTFMTKIHNDKFSFRPLRSNRNFANVIGKNVNKYDLRELSKHYDFGSVERTHKIQTSAIKIAKNKIMNFIKNV